MIPGFGSREGSGHDNPGGRKRRTQSPAERAISVQLADAQRLNSHKRAFLFRALPSRIRLCCERRPKGYDKGRPGGKGDRPGRPDAPRRRGHRRDHLRFRDRGPAERRQDRDSRLRVVPHPPAQSPHRPQPQDRRARGSPRQARALLQAFQGAARPGESAEAASAS